MPIWSTWGRRWPGRCQQWEPTKWRGPPQVGSTGPHICRYYQHSREESHNIWKEILFYWILLPTAGRSKQVEVHLLPPNDAILVGKKSSWSWLNAYLCNSYVMIFFRSFTFGLQTSLPVELRLATVSLIPVCESFSGLMVVMIMMNRSCQKWVWANLMMKRICLPAPCTWQCQKKDRRKTFSFVTYSRKWELLIHNQIILLISLF